MAHWTDPTIWTPEEVALRDAVTNLFKQNYSVLELQLLVEKSVLRLCLIEWGLKDVEALELLMVTPKKLIKMRDLSGFVKKLDTTTYFKNSKMIEEAQARMEKAKEQRAAQQVMVAAKIQALAESRKKKDGEE